MVERASADVRLRPGDLLGSGHGRAPGACSRSATRSSSATSSRATASRLRSTGSGSSPRPIVERPEPMTADVDALLGRLADAERRLAEHANAPLPSGLTDPDPEHRRALGGRPGLGAPRRVSRLLARAGAARRLAPHERAGAVRARQDRSDARRRDRARPSHRSGGAPRAGPQLARHGQRHRALTAR